MPKACRVAMNPARAANNLAVQLSARNCERLRGEVPQDVENIAMAHEAQLINYLKATEKEVGLLLNFGNNQNFP